MSNILNSRLFDQNTFYDAFLRDLQRAKSRVIIESPFITGKRMSALLPALQRLRRHNVTVIINTKPFEEHEVRFQKQAIDAVGLMQDMGIEILMTGGHHRKLAIIDDDILYEGSLNILSQNESRELMRRINDSSAVKEMMAFTGLKKWCK